MDKFKNKILVVSYDFFPDNSPNTYRWFNVLKSWKSHNLEIFVVTAAKENLLDFEEVEGIKVYRVGESILDKLKKNVAKEVSISKNQPSDNIHVVEKNSLIKKIYDLTWKKIYFPDFAFLWQKPAFRISEKLISEHNIYNVITVSWPFSDHVVGSRLKSKFNINWIADTIDPFYLSDAVNNKFLYKKLNKNLESRVLKKADSISVLTNKLKETYIGLYPHLEHKIIVNHNIFVPNPIKFNTLEVESNSTFKLTFVGTLTKITREPYLLLKFFSYLIENNKSNISYELHFYGNYQQFNDVFLSYEYLLNKSIFLHEFISRDKVTAVLGETNIVVNIGNNNMYQEPSKVLEYVYMTKPILNVCSIKDDTAKELLKFYPHTFNIEPDQVYDLEFIHNFQKFCKNNEIIDANYEENIKNYFLDVIQEKYFKLLKLDNE